MCEFTHMAFLPEREDIFIRLSTHMAFLPELKAAMPHSTKVAFLLECKTQMRVSTHVPGSIKSPQRGRHTLAQGTSPVN
jgi:hypothetical protein